MRTKTELAETNMSNRWQNAAIVGVTLLCACSAAYAADPLGDGICKLVTLLTGKWLFGSTILATLAGGAVVMFGGEISDGIKKLVTIITIVGMILAMSSLLTMVFNAFTSTC